MSYNNVKNATIADCETHLTGRFIGKVLDVYDGDTCGVAIDINRTLRYIRIRMLSYDAPEMKKKQRPFGVEVRDVLRDLILDKMVVVDIPKQKKYDPYGRTLGHIYVLRQGMPCTVVSCWSLLCPGCKSFNGEQDYTKHIIRDNKVEVPVTIDIPEQFHIAFLHELLHVNEWMINNTFVRPYDGQHSRSVWSQQELQCGYHGPLI